jgi:hypothetical protein
MVRVADVRTNLPYAEATIFAGFDQKDVSEGNVRPACELHARWPANYGDVYFRLSDGGLYDSGGRCDGS